MTVSTYQQTSLGTQAQSVDGDLSVLSRLGAAFAPHAQATPDMTVALDAGHVFDGAALTEVAAQSASLTAPAANPRIDRIVINQLTGTVSVVTGTEAASPAVPAIPSGFAPVARVRLSAGATVITNDMITDERDLSALGRIIAVEAGTGLTGGGSSGTVTISLETPVAVALGGTGTATAAANTVFAGPASGTDAAPSFRSLTLADLPADVATTEDVAAAIAVETERAESVEALLAPLSSPALTGTPTAPTAPAGTDTTQIATTAFVASAVVAGGLQHGQCYLTLSGGNLLLSPYNGNRLIIGGVEQTIPATGVSLAPTNLMVDTLYYIYAGMVSETMMLVASTTGHSTDATTGIEVMTGNSAYTFVGWACPTIGPAWVSSPAKQYVINYFNRRNLPLVGATTSSAITATALTEVTTNARAYFISCGESGDIGAVGSTVHWVGGDSVGIMVGLDGVAGGTQSNGMSFPGGAPATAAARLTQTIAEGLHYASPMAYVAVQYGTAYVAICGTIRG
ncbi:hypothetical protein [Telmatospirillum siberiense]|uniref:hypothetical protein n=1 Tax=Telmatospirillum siberiense TaxID=382514 RepID=UPI0018EADB3B|nr:hypothetical protein [Telmatospirillum siberiense]